MLPTNLPASQSTQFSLNEGIADHNSFDDHVSSSTDHIYTSHDQNSSSTDHDSDSDDIPLPNPNVDYDHNPSNNGLRHSLVSLDAFLFRSISL